MVDDEGAKAGTAAPGAVDGAYDAGDLGCGELLIELRRRILALRPGGVLEVTARDPGAPLDIPAWCFSTGHALVRERHPVYWIRCGSD